MSADIVSIGELLIDFSCVDTRQDGYPMLQANPGGAPANFLAAAAARGASTAMIAKVGADAFGSLLMDSMAQCGVQTGHILTTGQAFTTMAFVTNNKQGERSFSFARKPGADTLLSEQDVDQALIAGAKYLHFGTVSMTDEPARSATMQAVSIAKEHNVTVSFDPNLRPALWTSSAAMKEAMIWGLSHADVVKLSEEELAFLYGSLPPEAGIQKMRVEFGIQLVFLTLGASGCIAANEAGLCRVPAPAGITAVDTTGAGDIFGGTAISRLLQTGLPLSALSLDQLCEITSFACRAATLSTCKRGGISSVPTDTELAL